MRSCTGLLVVALLATACGSGETTVTSTTMSLSDTTTTTPASTTTTTTPASTTTTQVAGTSTIVTTTTAIEIDVEVSNGEVSGPETFEVALGDTVDIWVLSDVDDEVHVHGYDLNHALEAGVPFQLSFVADVPGIFEVEVHTNHTLLFELEVIG